MAYGLLTDEMLAFLGPLVRWEHIWDLGAGDLGHAKALFNLGAAHITAIEPHLDPDRAKGKAGSYLTVVPEYFQDAVPLIGTRKLGPSPPHLALLAWPVQYFTPGILELLDAAPLVAYLGCNFNGTSCGSASLFDHLRTRELITYIQHPRNSLIVVGKELPHGVRRQPTLEELAAYNPNHVVQVNAQNQVKFPRGWETEARFWPR